MEKHACHLLLSPLFILLLYVLTAHYDFIPIIMLTYEPYIYTYPKILLILWLNSLLNAQRHVFNI